MSFKVFNSIRTTKVAFYIIYLSIFFALLGCSTTSTILTRMDEKESFFNKLPNDRQNLITKGEIISGMTKEEVYISWGKPTSKTHKNFENNSYETWTYSKLKAGFSNGIGIDPFYDYNYFNKNLRYGQYYPYISPFHNRSLYNNGISYYPIVNKKVTFFNDRVNSWEELN